MAAPLARANRGAAALNLGQTGQAGFDMEAALQAAPEREAMDLARVYLARVYLARGETAQAIDRLDEAVAQGPPLPPTAPSLPGSNPCSRTSWTVSP